MLSSLFHNLGFNGNASTVVRSFQNCAKLFFQLTFKSTTWVRRACEMSGFEGETSPTEWFGWEDDQVARAQHYDVIDLLGLVS